MEIKAKSVYELVGGEATFQRLVDHFYAGVESDPVLRPLYPDADLTEASRKLRLFLIQYWGGPTTYDQERGHPRLRMRHAPFAIGIREREAWMRLMGAAVRSLDLDPRIEARLLEYFESAATAMINRPA